jgi:hypothetical protein
VKKREETKNVTPEDAREGGWKTNTDVDRLPSLGEKEEGGGKEETKEGDHRPTRTRFLFLRTNVGKQVSLWKRTGINQ